MQRLYFVTTIVAITVVAALNVFFNYQIAGITDSLTAGDPLAFEQQVRGILVVMVAMLLAEFVRQVCNQRFLNGVAYRIQSTILGRILRGPGLIKQSEIAGYISAIHNDSEMIKDLYYDTIFSLYQGIVSFLFASWALLALDGQLALAIFLVTLVPIGLPYLFQHRRQQVQEGISREKASYQVLLNDILSGLLVIKNSGLAALFLGRAGEQYKAVNQMEDRRAVLTALLNVLTGLSFYLLTVVILYLGGRQILAGRMTVGALVAIYSISLELTMPISLIASSISDMTSVQKLRQDLLQQHPALPLSPKITEAFASLEVKDLSYSVEDKEIFHGLNLRFEAGNKYLIQGESGAGKSTLAYLLTCQVEQEVEGIFLNQQAMKEWTYEEVQAYLAFLPQKVKLFHGSIWDNLTFRQSMSEEEVLACLQEFGLASRFASRKDLENEVFDAESTLSGGQQQRIALTRALLLRKPVLILDETLSGLDDRTFSMVEQALLQQKDLTLIHISHRSLQPEAYDQIVTLS